MKTSGGKSGSTGSMIRWMWYWPSVWSSITSFWSLWLVCCPSSLWSFDRRDGWFVWICPALFSFVVVSSQTFLAYVKWWSRDLAWNSLTSALSLCTIFQSLIKTSCVLSWVEHVHLCVHAIDSLFSVHELFVFMLDSLCSSECEHPMNINLVGIINCSSIRNSPTSQGRNKGQVFSRLTLFRKPARGMSYYEVLSVFIYIYYIVFTLFRQQLDTKSSVFAD